MVAAARSASRAALAVVVLTLLVATAACGAADPAGSPPPQTSGPPAGPCDGSVGQGDETTSALVGLSEAEATERAGASGLQVRIAGRGAECYALTADHQQHRVNLTLDDDGTVLAAGRG